MSHPNQSAVDQRTLDAGVRQSSMDGQTVTIDLEFLERRVREQGKHDLLLQYNNLVRPTVMRANFSGAFGGYGHHRP